MSIRQPSIQIVHLRTQIPPERIRRVDVFRPCLHQLLFALQYPHPFGDVVRSRPTRKAKTLRLRGIDDLSFSYVAGPSQSRILPGFNDAIANAASSDGGIGLSRIHPELPRSWRSSEPADIACDGRHRAGKSVAAGCSLHSPMWRPSNWQMPITS